MVARHNSRLIIEQPGRLRYKTAADENGGTVRADKEPARVNSDDNLQPPTVR